MVEPITMTLLALKGVSMLAGKYATAAGVKAGFVKAATAGTKAVVSTGMNAGIVAGQNIALAAAIALPILLTCCSVVYEVTERNKYHCPQCKKVLG
jgi:hypothetical protein